MDYFNYPVRNPSSACTDLSTHGCDELEFFLFLLLPLGALLLLDRNGIFSKKNSGFLGTALLACLFLTGLGALGFLPNWGQEIKLSAAFWVMYRQAR